MSIRTALSSKFTTADFRKELVRIMPGYKWTVHKSCNENRLKATGIQSSGFNRLSTLSVVRELDKHGYGTPTYRVTSSGFGLRSPWLGNHEDITLPRALRGLQQYYEMQANIYRSHAAYMQHGRKAEGGAE